MSKTLGFRLGGRTGFIDGRGDRGGVDLVILLAITMLVAAAAISTSALFAAGHNRAWRRLDARQEDTRLDYGARGAQRGEVFCVIARTVGHEISLPDGVSCD